MKWVCPHCPELIHGTRHQSVVRHIWRKHHGIGEPINLNSGLTRRQMGLNPSHRAAFFGRVPQGQSSYVQPNYSEPRTFDLCDWTEKKILQPLRQQVEFMNLLSQCKTTGFQGILRNGPQITVSPYTAIQDTGMQDPITVDLFGCKAWACYNCCCFGTHPFCFYDSEEVKPRSTTLEHACPPLTITMLGLSAKRKKMYQEYVRRLDLIPILKETLSHWNRNGILYIHRIKIPNASVRRIKIAHPTDKNKLFVVQTSQEDMTALDHIVPDHWACEIIGQGEEGVREISTYDKELDRFLISTSYCTFGLFMLKGENYFVVLYPSEYLNLTLDYMSPD